jgi:carbonic anhydrase
VFAWFPRTAKQIGSADRRITLTFLQRLIDGYNAFAGGRLQREQDRYRELAERGRSPDSHAHGISAALEFGVGALRVKHIVVLGHAHAGGHRRLVGARSRQRAIYRVARQ